MSFCEPFGLVGLACFVESGIEQGRRIVVQSPLNTNVANYLARMRVGRLLDTLGAEHDLPSVRESNVGDALLELESFDGAQDAERLATIVHSAAEAADGETASALYVALTEIGQNVPQHSGRHRGFMAAQWTHGKTQLHFAVGDSGIGMLATLASQGAETDEAALVLALSPSASGTGQTTRGVGLPEVLQCVSDLSGSLQLVSGAGYLTATGRQRWVRARDLQVAGTLVQGTVKIT